MPRARAKESGTYISERGKNAAFDTPSLRFIGGTGRYLHDGRFASLRELLVKSDGMMGHTAHLSPADLGALEAYLRSL